VRGAQQAFAETLTDSGSRGRRQSSGAARRQQEIKSSITIPQVDRVAAASGTLVPCITVEAWTALPPDQFTAEIAERTHVPTARY
jgi:hypothetical protein